jgi:hypothetical protein
MIESLTCVFGNELGKLSPFGGRGTFSAKFR